MQSAGVRTSRVSSHRATVKAAGKQARWRRTRPWTASWYHLAVIRRRSRGPASGLTVLDGAVGSLDLAFGPGAVGLGSVTRDPAHLADDAQTHRRRHDGVPVAGRLGEFGAATPSEQHVEGAMAACAALLGRSARRSRRRRDANGPTGADGRAKHRRAAQQDRGARHRARLGPSLVPAAVHDPRDRPDQRADDSGGSWGSASLPPSPTGREVRRHGPGNHPVRHGPRPAQAVEIWH